MPIKAFVFDAYGTLFDTQSVNVAVKEVFPDHGDYITYLWRQKQLEYSWLRTAMADYADFAVVTREALLYALATLAIAPDEDVLAYLCEGFDRLRPFAETRQALAGLSPYRLAILSNGSPGMLAKLLDHAGLQASFERVISADAQRVYKPHPAIYQSAVDVLQIAPQDILLVSSNGFDLAGAKRFGLKTARIARLPAEQLRADLADPQHIEAATIFSALRGEPETFGGQPDFVCHNLQDLVELAAAIAVPA